MDRVVAARQLVAELVKSEQIEVRRAEIVGRDVAKLVEQLGRAPSGRELEDLLGEHPQVEELYAAESVLDELAHRYFAAPSPAVAVSADDARHPELEQAIRDAPDRVEAYQIYADWLQERGDPFGELIALGIAADAGVDNAHTRFVRHLKQHEQRFLGNVGRHFTLKWRHGFVQAIEETGKPTTSNWQSLLGLRICHVVEAITCQGNDDFVIGTFAPPTLHTLTVERVVGSIGADTSGRVRTLVLHNGFLDITPEEFPRTLERLELGPLALRLKTKLDELCVRELRIVLGDGAIEMLRDVRLPNLVRLDLDLRHGTDPLVPFIEDLDAPRLTGLGLRDAALDVATFRQLAATPLAKQLTSLSLTHLGLSDRRVAELVPVGKFPALQEVDVSFNELTRTGVAAAAALAPKVISTRQLQRGSRDEQLVRRWAGSRLAVAEDIAEPRWWKDSGIDGDIRWARYTGEADYELFVTENLSRYGCSCPSSYQPCKHVVALALLAVRNSLAIAPSDGIEGRVTAHTSE